MLKHVPVLLNEVVEGLRAFQGGDYLDCTLGGCGHAAAILEAHFSNTVVGCDRDMRAVLRGKERFKDEPRAEVRQADFGKLLSEFSGRRKFDGILADLGLSSFQLGEQRGFSFQDDLLDMRMDEESGVSATTVVNEYNLQELLMVLKRGGMRQDAKRVANAIVRARPILSAKQLAQVVSEVLFDERNRHPATVVFQAIRIEVNDELGQISKLLEAVPQLANPGCRFAAISFHSLEDMSVTKQLRRWSSGSTTPAYMRTAPEEQSLGSLITKKAIVPSASEVALNPAARSARLRIFEFKGL